MNHQQRVLEFGNYLRLYNRVIKASSRLFLLGAVALASLLLFATAVQQDEKESGPKSALVFIEQQKPPAPIKEEFERLDPVLFLTGEAKITTEGLQRVNITRDALLRHPELGVLLLAHTDTVAPMALNTTLASKRAAAVRDSLVQGGGIAASRVFVAILPKGALPLVTNEEVDEQRNRSVQLRLFKMP